MVETKLSDFDFKNLKRIKNELSTICYRLDAIITEESWRRAKEKIPVCEDGKRLFD